jgi:hypothetical protein
MSGNYGDTPTWGTRTHPWAPEQGADYGQYDNDGRWSHIALPSGTKGSFPFPALLTFSANLKARPLVLPRLVGLLLPSILPAMTPSCSQATAASSRTPTTPPLSAEPYASLPAGLSTISRLTPPSPSAAVAPPCSLLPGCSSLRPLRSAPRRPPYRRMRRRRRPRRALSGTAVLPPASTARAVYQHHVIEVTGWGGT